MDNVSRPMISGEKLYIVQLCLLLFLQEMDESFDLTKLSIGHLLAGKPSEFFKFTGGHLCPNEQLVQWLMDGKTAKQLGLGEEIISQFFSDCEYRSKKESSQQGKWKDAVNKTPRDVRELALGFVVDAIVKAYPTTSAQNREDWEAPGNAYAGEEGVSPAHIARMVREDCLPCIDPTDLAKATKSTEAEPDGESE